MGRTDLAPSQVASLTSNGQRPAFASIMSYAIPLQSPPTYPTPLHSHSIVPGGFDVTSYTTRFTPFTSLMIRVAVSPRNFMSKG